jgi:hypothetical protein
VDANLEGKLILAETFMSGLVIGVRSKDVPVEPQKSRFHGRAGISPLAVP